ncbi:MAG: redoxin domain-containing protein [Planctomycetota bacterium]
MPTLRLPLSLLFLLPHAAAQEATQPLEGHSHIGEAFNEGARQAAYLMEGINPDVHFAVTTSAPLAQRFFDQGIVQLHGFWYFEAERSFRQAAVLDPDCAMHYWGMCLANIENETRAHSFAREAHRRRDQASERERMWIDAYARYYGATKDLPEGKSYEEPKGKDDERRRQQLIEDIEAIIDRFPDDIEAKALLANQLWIDSRDAGQKIRSRQANQGLLDDVFAAQPMHPAHHYRVHLWDAKETAARVTDSAAAIGHASPAIAHLWHMGGHIWSRLDRHDDAAWQQEASARVDHAYMMRDGVMPDQIHNYAHNNEWLCRSLRHVGRVHESIDLAKNMVELPRHPAWNLPSKRSSARYGPLRLRETLETYEAWDEFLALADTVYLDPGDAPADRASFHLGLGRAQLGRGRADLAELETERLAAMLADARTRRSAAVDAAESAAIAEGKSDADTDAAMEEARKSVTPEIRAIAKARDTLDALLACDAGDFEAGRPVLERVRFDKSALARLQLRAGNHEKAEKLAREAARDAGRAQPLADLAYVLHEIGKRDEAVETFATLRGMSARFDLEFAPFQRVRPLAEAAGLGADWRITYEQPEDTGARPPLESLGPFRWAPVAAPGWKLPDGHGQELGLAKYAGRPVLVVFFLGFGCVHCVEQLQALKPMTDAFRDAGIEIVAIGTDTVQDLTASQDGDSEDEAYKFPILADPSLDVFRAYRCHDDFEGMALHGTFLIDGDGHIRWQDIGYEPFMDLGFLLGESRRLLRFSLPAAPPAPAQGR